MWCFTRRTGNYSLINNLFDLIRNDINIEIQKIEALREFFKSKKAKLDEKMSLGDIAESLNDLIKNLDSLYNSDSLTEPGSFIYYNIYFKLMGKLITFEIINKDMEMVLNSLLSLIIISPDDKISKLVTTFCESVVKAPLSERFGIVKLRM